MGKRRPLKDYSKERFKIIKPEDEPLQEKWEKILEEEGLGRLPAERTYGILKDRREAEESKEAKRETEEANNEWRIVPETEDKQGASPEIEDRDNKWRAGENAPERHLISNAVWQTQAPSWVNNRTLLLRVLQTRTIRESGIADPVILRRKGQKDLLMSRKEMYELLDNALCYYTRDRVVVTDGKKKYETKFTKRDPVRSRDGLGRATIVKYTQTGFRTGHPGVKDKTSKMTAHGEEHKPASF